MLSVSGGVDSERNIMSKNFDKNFMRVRVRVMRNMMSKIFDKNFMRVRVKVRVRVRLS